MNMDVINEKQRGSCQDSQASLSRLTYYELALIFRTEFHSKSKAAVDLEKRHRDLIASAPSATAIMAP